MTINYDEKSVSGPRIILKSCGDGLYKAEFKEFSRTDILRLRDSKPKPKAELLEILQSDSYFKDSPIWCEDDDGTVTLLSTE